MSPEHLVVSKDAIINKWVAPKKPTEADMKELPMTKDRTMWAPKRILLLIKSCWVSKNPHDTKKKKISLDITGINKGTISLYHKLAIKGKNYIFIPSSLQTVFQDTK